MSLLLDHTIPTPCPAPRHPQSLTTLRTPQFGLKIAPTRGTRPRKATRGGAAEWDPTLDIFDDIAINDAQNDTTGQTLQAQEGATPRHITKTNNANIRKRRTSTLASPRVHSPHADCVTVDLKLINATSANVDKTDEAKKARRRTIYIPSDDTTMLTIHPGASLREQARRPRGLRRSDIFLDLAALSEEEGTAPDETASVRKQKQAQGRAIGAAPRRAPLARSQRVMQPNGIARDVVGTGGGKENLPPGWIAGSAKKGTSLMKPKQILGEASIVKHVESRVSKPVRPIHKILDTRPQHAKSRLSDATSTMSSPMSVQKQSPRTTLSSTVRPRCSTGSSPATRPTTRSHDLAHDVDNSLNTGTDQSATKNSKKVQAHRLAPRRDLASAFSQDSTEQYPILCNDVAMPALYTSEHLTSQEIALSQIINDVFIRAGHDIQETRSYIEVRKEMMCIHNTEDTVQLQQRLQASLRFGALSISKMALEKVGRIKDDLAQRQNFLDIWTKTYSLEFLQAAAEVVIGRELSKTARVTNSPHSSVYTVNVEACSTQRQTKAIQAFLRTFMLRNEDAPKCHGSPTSARSSGKTTDDNNDINSPTWLWRRTVVRSLLLIRLLDRFAPSNTSTFNSACLFQKSSPYKSSASILQAISSILIPSIGDPTRTLNHLNYSVSHVQLPLQEYTYRVTNPAIDFRDGIRLVRLIEIVLPEQSALGNCPTSSSLTCTLHCPAPTRTHKLYNVRLALSVLQARSEQRQDNDSLKNTLATLKPEDIVDGHREKTLALLWRLMLDCEGLGLWIPQDVLAAEIKKLRDVNNDDRASPSNQASTQNLLLEWARQCAIYHFIIPRTTQTKDIVDIASLLTNPNIRGTIYKAIASTYSQSDLTQLLKRDGKFVALYSSASTSAETTLAEIDLHTKETCIALLAVLARVLLMM